MAARESSGAGSSARARSFPVRALDEIAVARELLPAMPFRNRYLFVCTNRRPDGHPKGSCAEKGSEAIVPLLKEALAKRGVAKDVVRACAVGCLDLCEIGVAVLQEPDHVAYGRVSVADVEDIADAAARGGVVARLVVHGPASNGAGSDAGSDGAR